MLRWTCVLVVCMGLGALAANSHETGIGSASGSKATSCPCGMSKKKRSGRYTQDQTNEFPFPWNTLMLAMRNRNDVLFGGYITNSSKYNFKKERIVGGTKALPNEYPWIVTLVQHGSYVVMCGASIINAKVAITAAHCTHSLPNYAQMSIIAGTSDTYNPGQVARVSRWVEHESYYEPQHDASKTLNDIALLYLAQPLRFNTNVGPICLPTGKYNIENQAVKLIGWGKLGGNMPSTRYLMETDVKVIPFRTCQRTFSLRAPQTQICTQAPRSGACMGDSGGPVTYLDRETNRYTLVGLVSFGSGSCSPSVPTVMTEVSVFLPWIKSKINSLGCQKVNRRKLMGDMVGG